MKYKVKVYAKALADIATTKPAGEGGLSAEQIAQNFLKLLEKNGDMKKAKDIVALAENLFIKKTGRRRIILESARKVDKKEILKSFERQGDIVQEKIDKSLIAGIKITINDRQLDMSMRKRIADLFN